MLGKYYIWCINMGYGIISSIKKIVKDQQMQERKDKLEKLTEEERNNQLKLQKEYIKQLDNEEMTESLSRITRSQESEEWDKEFNQKEEHIRRYINHVLGSEILFDLKSKMPRSSFAGVRHPNRNIKRTNRLRDSLYFKGTGVDDEVYFEIPEDKVPYARMIDEDQKFITSGYWDKSAQHVQKELYESLKELEDVLGIKVTWSRWREKR